MDVFRKTFDTLVKQWQSTVLYAPYFLAQNILQMKNEYKQHISYQRNIEHLG